MLDRPEGAPAGIITHQPRPDPTPTSPGGSDPPWTAPSSAAGDPRPDRTVIKAHERVLTDWFERRVVLLSSGRTGLAQLLALHQLSRHRDNIWIAPYLSRCVINALTYNAFPTSERTGARAALVYHQFGFSQRCTPDLFVIEDLAHAFFSSPSGGQRRWQSEHAVFSLPKFFPTAGLVGGVITSSDRVADKLQRAVEASSDEAEMRRWMTSVVAGGRDDASSRGGRAGRWLDAVYELLYALPAPTPSDIVGMPTTLGALGDVGAARAERIELFRSAFGTTAWPEAFVAPDEVVMPYALPYFGAGGLEPLRRADRALAAAGIEAGIYHVDVRRDMSDSDYRPCLLLPCHQDVPVQRFHELCAIVKEASRPF